MLVLRFNAEAMYSDLCKVLVSAANEIMEHFLKTAELHLKEKDAETEAAILDMAAGKISATCIFYARSILESYGTGSKMDITNPYLDEYMESIYWNPDRRRFAISGRRAGAYVNIFGETVVSSGKYRGKEIEDIVPAVAPSFAIQNAEKQLDRGLQEDGYAMRILKMRTDEFFETMNPSDYFYNEEI